ncbi:hypothetical protein J2D73_16510 [Acetobacter sacchari]|uniref:Uncharacterized protein n=1 Tax=Acetobacter sacchari TaxID=2661687 RepID=A0ABS3LZP2_9PROT|nr:hypothetical protein [Acetobacter sacchari]MBO1361389.1 hypothetical protein [Acetobacter sacchari]
MKTGKEHRVSWSDGAVAILQDVRPLREMMGRGKILSKQEPMSLFVLRNYGFVHVFVFE